MQCLQIKKAPTYLKEAAEGTSKKHGGHLFKSKRHPLKSPLPSSGTGLRARLQQRLKRSLRRTLSKSVPNLPIKDAEDTADTGGIPSYRHKCVNRAPLNRIATDGKRVCYHSMKHLLNACKSRGKVQRTQPLRTDNALPCTGAGGAFGGEEFAVLQQRRLRNHTRQSQRPI